MAREDAVFAFKMLYTLVWMFFTSYYYWGAKEETVTAPIDESGWVPDGEFAKKILQVPETTQPAGE